MNFDDRMNLIIEKSEADKIRSLNMIGELGIGNWELVRKEGERGKGKGEREKLFFLFPKPFNLFPS
jgi:hypothetical protein